MTRFERRRTLDFAEDQRWRRELTGLFMMGVAVLALGAWTFSW